MKVIADSITLDELKRLAAARFGNMVKAVVDVDRQLMAVDAGLHSDLEAIFLADGSKRQDLWGIKLYPESQGDAFIKFDSMINVRPSQNNNSHGVENPAMRQRIIELVLSKIKR